MAWNSKILIYENFILIKFRYCSNFPTATSKYNKIVTDSQSKSTKAAFFRRCSSRSPDSDPGDPFKTRRRLRRGIGSISSINVLWDDSDDAGEYRRLKEEPHFATVSRIVTNFAYIKIPQNLSFLCLFPSTSFFIVKTTRTV